MNKPDTPAKVAPNAGLGPLPEARMPDANGSGWFTAGQMFAYAAEQVAAERERMISDGWRQTRYLAPVTDCEACLTPDACAIRGQCGHYLRERASGGEPR